jgi:anti-sigma regulatory factor (Ser/Thr protein kinase)
LNQTVTEKIPRVRLELESRPESVTLVRGMLAGLGETLQLEAELLDDLKTAVSEACNNVVMHAYGDETGELAVEFAIGPEELWIWVRDKGGGIRGIAPTSDRMGVGLAIISALSEQASFSSRPGHGTEVRMTFPLGGHRVALSPGAELNGGEWPTGLDGDVLVRLTPTELLGAVLGRVVRALAARAHFSVDRLDELDPVADAISEHVRMASQDARIGFALGSAERQVELTIGPFPDGSGERLEAQLSRGPSTSALARIADEVSTTRDGGSELLRVVVSDTREGDR